MSDIIYCKPINEDDLPKTYAVVVELGDAGETTEFIVNKLYGLTEGSKAEAIILDKNTMEAEFDGYITVKEIKQI